MFNEETFQISLRKRQKKTKNFIPTSLTLDLIQFTAHSSFLTFYSPECLLSSVCSLMVLDSASLSSNLYNHINNSLLSPKKCLYKCVNAQMHHTQVDKAWNNKKNIRKVQFTDKRDSI